MQRMIRIEIPGNRPLDNRNDAALLDEFRCFGNLILFVLGFNVVNLQCGTVRWSISLENV